MQQVKHIYGVFFWREEQHSAAYSIYRAANDAEKRDADDLPPEEVANAVKKTVKEQISISKEDLVRETAKLFGFSKVSNNVDMEMRGAIQLLIETGAGKEKRGRVMLREGDLFDCMFSLAVTL